VIEIGAKDSFFGTIFFARQIFSMVLAVGWCLFRASLSHHAQSDGFIVSAMAAHLLAPIVQIPVAAMTNTHMTHLNHKTMS